ncbi:MAG: ABC transporter ATP-binding protein [Blastocatellales bacterium]
MSEPNPTPAIEFRDVSIAFDDRVLLDRISFVIERGEMGILIGPSKSGKSTILKMAIGLVRPDSGRIFLDGREVTAMQEEELLELREKTGVVFQHDALFSMSVAENVAYRLAKLGFTPEEAEAEVRRVLEVVGLEAAYDLMPDELSGGMSRRAAVARGMAGTPSIMLYDSACSGLDPIVSRQMLHEVIRLRDLKGVSSIYITQNMDQVQYLCSNMFDLDSAGEPVLRRENKDFCLINTRIIMLSDGKIIFNRVDEFFWENNDEKIRRFIT